MDYSTISMTSITINVTEKDPIIIENPKKKPRLPNIKTLVKDPTFEGIRKYVRKV